jgi:hypothetical protein
MTPAGFHAMILSTRRTMFIDPVQLGDPRQYVSHFKRTRTQANPDSQNAFTCEVEADPVIVEEIRRPVAQGAGRSTGTELRTYRTAIAATGNTPSSTVAPSRTASRRSLRH